MSNSQQQFLDSDSAEYYNLPIFLEELQEALSKVKTCSPGLDQIANELLKIFPKPKKPGLLDY